MQHIRISIMAAITDELGIGKDNDLLVKIPEDFARVRSITKGHPLVRGRKSFESIGRPLPSRTNIVITRDTNYQHEGIVVVHSLAKGLEIAKKEEEQKENGEIFVFGGGQIWKEALPMVGRLYLTVIHKNFPADTFFPDYSQFTKVIEKEEHLDNNPPYTFLTLER